MNDLAGFLPFVLIALVFWFLIVRPQRRRQRELASTQSSIGPGTEVMLGSGIFGTVVSLDDETLQLELSPGTTVKVARQAVVKVLGDPAVDGVADETRADEPETQHGTDEDPGSAGPADERHP